MNKNTKENDTPNMLHYYTFKLAIENREVSFSITNLNKVRK